MKNEYYNGWSAQFPIRDGHNWGRCTGKAQDWDGAECQDCGVVASNAQISSGAPPKCSVPVPIVDRLRVKLEWFRHPMIGPFSAYRYPKPLWFAGRGESIYPGWKIRWVLRLGRTEFKWWGL